MTQSAIRISESYAIPPLQRAQLENAKLVYGAAQPAPDELGGYFDFVDWRGRPVANTDFMGRWSLLYFGYCRCTGSCQTVAPNIARAARDLRAKGFAAQAVFVDIESPPPGSITPLLVKDAKHVHGTNLPKTIALSKMVFAYGDKLRVLTGSRYQLAQATTAFHVLREHVPPRAEEANISINHSALIYLVGPDTLVAGYGYHDMESSEIVSLITQLDKAERKEIDFAAIKARYAKGACGR